MPAPIDYTTPTQDYDTPVSAATTGLNFNRAQQSAEQAAAPAAQVLAADTKLKDQNAEASQYQQLLNSGISGAKAYVADLSKDYPDIASDFDSRLDTMTPWLKTLKGEESVKAFHEMYDNVNSRVIAAKMGAQLQNGVPGPDGKTVPPTNDQLISTMQNPKDMIASRINGERSDTNAKKVGADVNKASAMTDYYKALPALKEKIATIAADAKIRAAEIKTINGGKAAKFQYTMDIAQKNLKSVNASIAALTNNDPAKSLIDPDTGKPMPETDPRYPMMSQVVRAEAKWDVAMANAIKERNTYQTWANHASEHDAKPGDSIGTDEVRTPEPTAKSSDAEIAQYLQANNKAPSPENIKIIRQKLGGDSTRIGQ